MARRKKRFSAVATRPSRGSQFKPRRFNIAASVMRKGKQYAAVACPKFVGAKSLSPTRYRNVLNRCGNGLGGTPTEAVKRALTDLSRKLK